LEEYDSTVDTLEHIRQVQLFMLPLVQELLTRLQVHDASKLVSPEKEGFDKFTPLLADLEYDSDEYREIMTQMGPALTHHYAHNRHHPEFHKDGTQDMNLLDLVEMICDWKAAGLRHKAHPGDLRSSIEKNQARFGYSEELKRILLNTAELFESEVTA
jgi:Family of unknown function (DUF5662)